MIEKNDTQFFVGTVNRRPWQWIIVGLFYPRLHPGLARTIGDPAELRQGSLMDLLEASE